MAGHSKWANTKHRKASQDVKKSKMFTKIIRSLIIASKSGGDNPNTNAQLRTIIDKALSYNVPREIIKRAIQKNILDTKNSQLQSIKYGGYGRIGIAIIIECLSNNKNRTVSEIRYILSKFDYNLKPISSIQYLFEKKVMIYYTKDENQKIIEKICYKYDKKYIIKTINNDIQIITHQKYFKEIKSKLHLLNIQSKDVIYFIKPIEIIQLNKDEQIILTNLIKKLKSNTDIKNIYHNSQLNIDKIK